MQDNAKIEQSPESLYNNDNGISVDMKKQKPLYDAKCDHDHYHDVEDADNTEYYRVIKCRNCPTGYLEALK